MKISRATLLRASMIQRFHDHCDRSGDCWIWTGKARGGYGQINSGSGFITVTHISLLVFTGRILEDGELVCHKCDNPSCVNPDHLFVGDHRANMRDMIAKGRRPHPSAKLSPAQVEEIRRSSEPRRKLAARYSVCQSTIGSICRGDTWREVA